MNYLDVKLLPNGGWTNHAAGSVVTVTAWDVAKAGEFQYGVSRRRAFRGNGQATVAYRPNQNVGWFGAGSPGNFIV